MSKEKTYIGVIISEDSQYIGKAPVQPELGSLVIVKETDWSDKFYMTDDGYFPNGNWSWTFSKRLIEIIEEIQE